MIADKAVVELGASLGADVTIAPFAHVMSGAVLGDGVRLGVGVFVGAHVKIGRGCWIQNHAQIVSGVTLEADVLVGAGVVFTNALSSRAFRTEEHALVTTVLRGATLGANATIFCGTTLGQYCLVAPGAVVTSSVLDHAFVLGHPAVFSGWVSRAGHRMHETSVVLPQPGSAQGASTFETLVCPETGERYRKTAEGLLWLP